VKALKLSAQLPLLALALLTFCAPMSSSVAAQTEIALNDHEALVKHYENEVKEVEAKLQKNKAVLKEYEAHPYYFGRQGQELRSHTTANIREYEKTLRESLSNADLHRRMAAEQDSPINKAKVNLDRDSTAVR